MTVKRHSRSLYLLPLVTALGCLTAISSASQNPLQDRSYNRLPGYNNQSAVSKTGEKSSAFSVVAPPSEEVLDPHEYVVGPNDIFGLQIPGVWDVTYPLAVTPEGFLLIPNVGSVSVAGRTLHETRGIVLETVSKASKIGTPVFALLSPRQILVTVLGMVRNPGPYVVTAAMRVDKAIALANNTSPADREQGWTGNISRRRIVLRRKGEAERLVDIESYTATRITKHNPYLQEGDVLIVPPRNVDQASVSVYGGVNRPGEYEYREYDSLLTLIRIADGFSPNADHTNVEVTSFDIDAAGSTTRVVDLTDVLDGRAPDILLENKDRVVVRQKEDRRRDFKVYVQGEVRSPGIFPITPDSTLLSEIIARAGGVTEYAFLAGAHVERRLLSETGSPADMNREMLLNARLNDQLVTLEERAYYEMESHLRQGTVSVDFIALLERKDRSADIFLKDGDIIVVPNSMKTVYVFGQVSHPGYVPFKEGADVLYYVQQAGGFGEEADEGEVRVIKRSTKEWKHPSDTTVESGDYIWIPKDIRYPTGYYLNLVSQAATFLSVVLSMTVIILQLTKD